MKVPEIIIREKVSLRDLTTFRVGGLARYFTVISDAGQLPLALAFARGENVPWLILGGGSNMVISDHGYDGFVIKMANQGVDVRHETAEAVTVRVAAGENWDSFVAQCVSRGWWGVENMSLIPGSVGALPIQNVGAYGQEARDTVMAVDVWDTQSSSWKTLSNQDCSFAYRRSIFNTTEAGRYVVSAVHFRLFRKGIPNLTHAAVRNFLQHHPRGVRERLVRGFANRVPRLGPKLKWMERPPSLQNMRACVMALRTDGRLPNPAVTGNAGSFFKNVSLNDTEFHKLLERLRIEFGEEAMRRIKTTGTRFQGPEGYKIPAADLVNLCGLQGAREGGAALYPRNSIVLVNEDGRATAQEIVTLAERIQESVFQCTGVTLSIEPKLIGF